MVCTAEDKKIERLELYEDQQKFCNALSSGEILYPLFGGTIDSGKTIAILRLIAVLCKIYPGSRWAIVRKDLPTFKKTTLMTFNKYFPQSFIKSTNYTDWVWKMHNGSEVLAFMESIQEDPDLNRWKGLEVNGFFLNQVEELQEKTFWKAVERAGRWTINNQPPAFIFSDCNPCNSWVRALWYDPYLAGKLQVPYYFHPADITKNPYAQPRLKTYENLPEAIYKRFVKGDWDAVEDIDALMRWNEIIACSEQRNTDDKTFYLGCDVGRMGADKTVFTLLQGDNIHSIQAFNKTLITDTEEKILKYIAEFHLQADKICVDSVGLGAGVVDNLKRRGYHVNAFVGGASPTQALGSAFTFANLKAETYWYAAEAIKKKTVGNINDQILKSDASAIRYSIKNDKCIAVESKDDLKKRIGRSCDYWDSFTYAYWMLFRNRTFSNSFMYSAKDYENDRLEEMAHALP